jgi:hypothetical protein
MAWVLLTGTVLAVSGTGAWLTDRELRLQEADAFALPDIPRMSLIDTALTMAEAISSRRALPNGMPAPDLTVPALVGDGTFHLADHLGSRPVVLVFGSFT